MITRQAFNKDGQKIPFAIYPDDYVIETEGIGEMAFMPDDDFPYFYCGKIVLKKSDGQVKISGISVWQNPKFIVEYDKGIEIWESMKKLNNQRITELNTVNSHYETLLGWLLSIHQVINNE